jgi:hypothetical protein
MWWFLTRIMLLLTSALVPADFLQKPAGVTDKTSDNTYEQPGIVNPADTFAFSRLINTRRPDWRVEELKLKTSINEVFTPGIYELYDLHVIPNEDHYLNVIYIDPDYAGVPDGSSERPYPSLMTAPQKNNTAYLLKRGTTHLNNSGHYIFNVDSILVGAYGSGERPVISGAGGIIFAKNNAVIRDLELRYIQFGLWQNEIRGGTVFNVKTSSAWAWARDLKYIGVEIVGATNDGLFIQQRDFSADSFIEVGFSHIHKVNQNWTPVTDQRAAGGDGIQISGIRGKYHIHNTIIDRSDTGNKFAIIVNANDNGGHPVAGIIENCWLYGPMPQPDGVAIIYIGNVHNGNHERHHHVIIRNNAMLGSTYNNVSFTGSAVYSNSSRFEIHDNYFKNLANPLRLGNQPFGRNRIFNNLVIPLTVPVTVQDQ